MTVRMIVATVVTKILVVIVSAWSDAVTLSFKKQPADQLLVRHFHLPQVRFRCSRLTMMITMQSLPTEMSVISICANACRVPNAVIVASNQIIPT
jgi:hypothetical protein